jgi:hypothetical protein
VTNRQLKLETANSHHSSITMAAFSFFYMIGGIQISAAG